MKLKTILATAAMVATVAMAQNAQLDTTHDYADGEQSPSLVTPELQAAATQMFGNEGAQALLHAARLQMAKYDNDMKTQAGRKAWHGKMIDQIVDEENEVKIEVYSNTVNGAIWRYKMPFKKPAPRSVTVRNYTPSTNGIPPRLAAARIQRAQAMASAPIVTNVVINANEGTNTASTIETPTFPVQPMVGEGGAE